MKKEYVRIKIGFGEKTSYIIAVKGDRVRLPDGTYVTAGSNIEDRPATKSEIKQDKKAKKLELKRKK